MTWGHRGSLLLRCRAFSSLSSCRFIPALSPRSPPPGRRVRRPAPALPRQPRHGYAAALPPGLLTGHYQPATESLAAIVARRACTAARPRSARFGAGTSRTARQRWFLASTCSLHLLVLLAGPGPSGSASPSRRCQGCSHPPVRLHDQAALSAAGLLRQASGGALPSPPGRGSASWRR